jgi:hypothetical protein
VQRLQSRGQIVVALPERQVNVLTAAHVLNRDRGQLMCVGSDGLGGFVLAGDEQVADVEREPKRLTDQVAGPRPVRQRLDEHPRLGLEGDAHPTLPGVSRHLRRTLGEALPGPVGLHPARHAGPERHRL